MTRPGWWRHTLVLMGLSSLCEAQLGILEKVFDEVTNVNAYLAFGKLLGNDPLVTDTGGVADLGLRGFGVEVSFDLFDDKQGDRPPEGCNRATRLKYTPKERTVHFDSLGKVQDSTLTSTAKEVEEKPSGKALEEEKARHKKLKCREPASIGGELALGYSQLSGLVGRTLDVRGSLEELPSVTFYLQYDFGGGSPLALYAGMRTGLVQLKSLRAFSGDLAYTASGSTYQLGVAPGVAIGKDDKGWGVFIEGSVVWRKFHNVDWTGVKDAVILPELRGPLNVSTFSISIGAQVIFGGGKKDKEE